MEMSLLKNRYSLIGFCALALPMGNPDLLIQGLRIHEADLQPANGGCRLPRDCAPLHPQACMNFSVGERGKSS